MSSIIISLQPVTLHQPPLSDSLARVLDRLLDGLSEKQVALSLQLSVHTVHAYSKKIYRAYGVGSRSELFAKFLGRDSSVHAPRPLPDVIPASGGLERTSN